jgi:hypothetical protein
MSNFMKIRQVGAELFHADGWTDTATHDEVNSRFRNFANAPKNHAHFFHLARTFKMF